MQWSSNVVAEPPWAQAEFRSLEPQPSVGIGDPLDSRPLALAVGE